MRMGRKVAEVAGELTKNVRELRETAGVDHERGHQGAELVSCGPLDQPVDRQVFPGCKDLLDHQPGGRSLESKAGRKRARIPKPVDVIDAQSVDRAVLDQCKRATEDGVENGVDIDADSGER